MVHCPGSVTRIRLPLSHVFCDALSWIWGTVDKSKDKVTSLPAMNEMANGVTRKSEHLVILFIANRGQGRVRRVQRWCARRRSFFSRR